MENYSFLFYVFCIIIFIIIGKIFVVPFKRIIKLIINSVFGGIAIYVIMELGEDIHIATYTTRNTQQKTHNKPYRKGHYYEYIHRNKYSFTDSK